MFSVLSAADPRMTIHHSGALERQDNCGRIRERRNANRTIRISLDVIEAPEVRSTLATDIAHVRRDEPAWSKE
jgi:hypothetical protein